MALLAGLVLLSAGGSASTADAGSARRYTVTVGLTPGGYYTGEVGYVRVSIKANGEPAGHQAFRIQAIPLNTTFTTPVMPKGGEFQTTDEDGEARVPIKFRRTGRHRVAVAVGRSILDANEGTAVTVDVKRRWYRRLTPWLALALGIAVLTLSIPLRRRGRRSAQAS